MYPNTYTCNPLRGACMHRCHAYCFVDMLKMRFPNMRKKYSGPPEIDSSVLKGNTGSGKTIFVCSCTDLFAENVSENVIETIIKECAKYPDNTYLFQSKNPVRLKSFIHMMPKDSILGTTIETNRQSLIDKSSHAPSVVDRVKGMKSLVGLRLLEDFDTMVSIEPLMDFDVDELVQIIEDINPT